MTTRSPKTYKKPQPLPDLPSSPSSPTRALAELARISSSSPSRQRQWADAAAPAHDPQSGHPQPPQRLPLSKRRPTGPSLKFMHDVGGTGSASSSAAGHSPTSPTSPTALSRRIDGPSTRPGTASTVSSYVSARPFMDEASPVRNNLRLPPIDPLQSPVYLQRSTDEMSSTNSDNTTIDRLPSATSSVYTLPIGANANHANIAMAEPRSPTSGKRLILASANTATHGYVAESGGEEDVRSITSSSRRTLQAHDDSATSSSSCDHSSAADVNATPRPRSQSRVSSRGTRKHAAVDGRSPDERVSAPSRAPPEAPKSLPVHPHHRKHRDGPTDDEGAESSSASLSPSPVPQEGSNNGANTIRSPTSRARTLSYNVSSSSSSNPHAETLKEDVQSTKRTPLQDSNVPLHAMREDAPAARSTSNLASDYVTMDKSPANSNSAAGGTGLREKFKKTGGFFRRLGGGGGNAGAANSAGRAADEHSNEGNGPARQENADGSVGLQKSSSPLLSPPSRRNILRTKASHSSLVSESGTVNARRMSGASRSDENSSRSRETNIPVPAVPAQYRDQSRTPDGLSKQDGTLRKDSQLTMSPSTKSSAILEQDQSIPYSASNTTVRGGPKGHKKSGNAAQTSTDFDRAMRSWEKEMDAALDKTGKDLAEKTKIEPPKPNWTPSPQLPEYRVLNRKGSFMDEGTDDNRARHLNGQDDEDDDDDLKYTTVKSHFAPADSSHDVDKSTLASTFGISVGRHAKTSTDKGSESISYDSHFLRPEASRMPRRSEPGQLLAGAANGRDSLKSVGSSRNVPAKAKRSVSEFKNPDSDDTENTRPLREDNASIATFRSFETAVDRFSTITRHGGTTNAAAVVDESTSDKAKEIAKQSPQITPLPTLPSKNPIPSPLSSPIDNELSIRPVPRPSADSSAENVSSPIDDGKSAPKQSIEKDDEQEMAKQLAQKCWTGDETFKKREKIAEWLGGFGAINKDARQLYFANFDFQDLSVDAALRKLCDKLYLRAETQQVDRILSAFSQRYFECNRKTQFGSADVVHAVTFSILLLNTDLHVAELSDRMTRPQFVRNTLDAVLEQDKSLSSAKEEHDRGVHLEGDRTGDDFQKWETQMEATLRDIYQSVKSDRIRLPMSDADALTQRGPASPMRTMGSERMTALKRGSIRGIQSLMGGGAMAVSSNAAFGQGTSVGSNGANASPLTGSSSTFLTSNSSGSSSMGPPVSWNATPSVGFANTLSKSIIRETHDEINEDNESVGSDKEDVTDEELALLGPPWAKEGMLTRKHYWEAPSKRAKDKNWIDCFTVIQKGQLSMFRFGTTTTSSGTVKQAQAPGIGGGNWLSNATLIGQFSLAHSLANILPPPGYNRSRPHVFALTLSSGSVYFFQSAHEELAQEWTSTCNYWAARLSKEPLAAGISNMEYGWNRVQAFSNDDESADGSTAHLGEADAPSTVGAGAGGRRKSVAGSTTESELIESSPTSQYPYASSSPYGNAKSGDARSIRSGRSGRSGRSSRMRATLSSTLFQNWSNGNTLERISSNQSGKSSPVTSVISLSTPGTSITASDRPFIVHEWRAPAPPTTSSTLSEEEQLEACIRHTQRIEQELTHHNSLHQPMMQLFKQMSSKGRLLAAGKGDAASSLSLSPPSKSAGASAVSLPSPSASSHKKGYGNGGVGGGNVGGSGNVANMAAKALANWERKSAHLLAELTKFQVYIDSLKSASRTRSETNAQRQLNRMMRQADED